MRNIIIPLCLAASLVLAFGAGNASAANQNYIGEERAKAIALKDAGLSEAQLSHVMCGFDYDDGVAEYEVEFWVESKEYEYEINATTGRITGKDIDYEGSFDLF